MISIIIPVYNRQNTIGRAIISVLNQTYNDFEVIVINDNSNDDTEKVIKTIKDKRIKYIKQIQNMGANRARNIGIDLAKGDYIAFQDSDDEWNCDKLEVQIKALIKSKADIVACSYYQYKNGKKRLIPKYKMKDNEICKRILYNNFIGTPSILGKKECFIKEKFDENLPRFQDWELMIRMSQKYNVHFINKPLMNAYVQEDSLSENHLNALITLKIIIARNAMLLSNDKIAMKHMYKKLGLFEMMSNKYTNNYFAEALKLNWYDIKLWIRYLQFEINKYIKNRTK